MEYQIYLLNFFDIFFKYVLYCLVSISDLFDIIFM